MNKYLTGFVVVLLLFLGCQNVIDPKSIKVVDADSLAKYLQANYGTCATSLGPTTFEFGCSEYSSITDAADFWIRVHYDMTFFYDLEYSRKITTQMNNIVCQELKNHQEKIAKAAFEKFPGKKIEGGYFESGYTYPSIHEGYWSRRYFSWRNYCGTTPEEYGLASDHYPYVYENAPITGFGWTTYMDDKGLVR